MRKKKATQELSKIGKLVYSLLIAGVAFLVVNGISGIGLFILYPLCVFVRQYCYLPSISSRIFFENVIFS